MKYIEDYIEYIGDKEFVDSLTIPETIQYHLQLKESIGYNVYKLQRGCAEFAKEINKELLIESTLKKIKEFFKNLFTFS